MSKILVTGGLGNIGSATLRELIARKYEVSCLNNASKKNSQRAKEIPQVNYIWGDITDYKAVSEAVSGQDMIVHLAAILPPSSDEDVSQAEAVNVGGTENILKAASSQEHPPKIFFSSSFDTFGPTMDQEPPRKVTDPLVVTDPYSQHKITCEKLIKASGLTWTIYRFVDVPPMEARQPHPIMFRIPLEQRFEVVHPADAALAIANGLENERIWGSIWLVGGGTSCQIYYKDYLRVGLRQAGLGEKMFPAEAFSQEPYCTDWLDSTATEALLHYQHHTFDEIMADVDRATAPSTLTKIFIVAARPFIRRWVLSFSTYKKSKGATSA